MSTDHDNLEEFADPELYDLEFGEYKPSGPFFESVARTTGGPVLDLACGTGWLAIPLARMGFAVTGVDIAPAMLARARKKAADLPVRWLEADCRRLDLGTNFALATMTGYAFQSFLTDEDQNGLIASVHRHLQPGGVFAFETRNRRPADIAVDGGEGFWHSFRDVEGRDVDVYLREYWDPATELLDCHTFRRWRDGSRPEQKKRIKIRYIDAGRLSNRLRRAGFEIDAQYGDWDCSPVTADSPEIITLARRH